MPDGQRRSRARADEPVLAVRAWLRTSCRGAVTTLPTAEIDRYAEHVMRHGWEVTVDVGGQTARLCILLPAGFPYARPRITLASEDRYLKWPHVEDFGLLCLPVRPVDPADPVEMVKAALAGACTLIEECRRGATNEQEFRREFISYWNRHSEKRTHLIRSLLAPEGDTRPIAVWRGKTYDIVGEGHDDIVRWLTNIGATPPPAGFSTDSGLLVRLSQPPVPTDFPATVPGLRAWLERDAPGGIDQLAALSDVQAKVLVVLEASTAGLADVNDAGPGFMAVGVNGSSKVKVHGFRPGKAPPHRRRAAWLADAGLSRHKVDRIDAAWVHGRGKEPAQAILHGKTVGVLGCGAVGSHVAVRLAQAGVGALLLVDPQVLEAANVGRHALGMSALGGGKAQGLARDIAQRFPHMRAVDWLKKSWAMLDAAELERIANCDIIVSAVGEWSAEGPINEWHVARGAAPPIVYAWLEEQGVAGHALAIDSTPGCLHCLLHGDGSTIEPETNWPSGSMLRTEPACGSMYQPFGPVELGYAEALVVDLCVDVLLGKVTRNTHRIYATSTARLTSLGGSWTSAHAGVRPPGFTGPLVANHDFASRSDCPVCSSR